ncbi:hypothetical protein PHYPSEUDO_002353 [Phytophthora pseudosyringae]|uniref:Uncharacterized protein n=1 Tax=Phytophthora pseudosyringae TaxID=221518 RepID=A0A8T1VWT3_9STRA|nr:hypothetical protein PHYPSEUDO_002353 [Phytophthora pseudosyringae]
MAPASSSLLRRDVSAALQVLATRVVVKAHQLMLPPVHTRATRTGESLLQLTATPSSSRNLQQASMHEAAKHFVAVVEALVAFVTTFAKTDKFVFHLASMRRMYLDLYAVGARLDLVAEIAGLQTMGP